MSEPATEPAPVAKAEPIVEQKTENKYSEESLRKSVDEIVEKTVGKCEYCSDKVEGWAEGILSQVYKLTKRSGYKSAVLVEIFPLNAAYLKKMKHLSIPGTDVVSLITKKTDKLIVMVFIVMMNYR
ncbi:hypothetical protein AAMO2058_001208400 [Amorphochlora amoebiformis]